MFILFQFNFQLTDSILLLGYMRRQNYMRANLYSTSNTERRDHPPPSYNTPYKTVEVPGARRELVSPQINVQPTKVPENLMKSQPQQMKSLQAKPLVKPASQQQRNTQIKFPLREAEQSQAKLSHVYVQQQPKAAQKSFRPLKPLVRKVELLSNPQQPENATPQKLPVKPSPEKDPGLLTDSLSCIFTRRVNQQRKLSQSRSLIENLPQISVSEVPKEKPEETPHYESIDYCPNPPRISQPTPNISTEDWFTTKQRILGNVKPDSAQFVTEPMKIPDPDPPRVQVDPEGFDIEPPVPMNHNVSPYIPSDNFERDEYERYKKDKLKNEITYALLQKHYGQVKVSNKLCQEDKSPAPHSDNQPSEMYHQDAELKEEYPVEKDQYDSQEYQYQYEPAENTQYTNDSQRYGEQSDQYREGYDKYMDQAAQEENYDGNNPACPEAPNISSVPQQDPVEHVPPEAPEMYHQETQYYKDYAKYDETNTFKEPLAILAKPINKTMCHKCSFQTTDLKKLRAHLKFVHGEVIADSDNQSPKNELFSRREAKTAKDELFSRRENFAGNQQQVVKKRTFRRRNTVAPNVNVISSEVVVEAKGEDPGGNETIEAEN
ncbi:unnamed protein product [Ceutorhynchus assimilis]|uniref:Uncharacterized protein n=1 Tax=Ceutorhynchus assimilis TaxID=467358 RepID=A0A9N9MB52_9CUCU|nr:unnamed protein product [Ceutorhynchus assimilis]